MHMAVAAVANALWDLAGKRAGKPMWKLLVDMSPEHLVDLLRKRSRFARRAGAFPVAELAPG
jgi:L-alanine-DL-glutamate epimerase-like enolase superfamily enzyme